MTRVTTVLLIACFSLMGCGNKGSTVGYDRDSEVIPLGTYSTLRPTVYYLPKVDLDTERCSSNDLRDVRGAQGQTLITVCEKTYKSCLMQGSCLLMRNGVSRLLNYAGSNRGVHRFNFTDRSVCPYGFGVKEICLDPYFSVAADLKYHKAGDVIFVSKLRGLPLPDGRTHDGYVVVRDTGENIVGRDRFDFFTGEIAYRDSKNTMARLGLSDKKNRFQYIKVDASIALRIRSKRLFPGIRK